MDDPMTASEAEKTHVFKNCRLRIVRGDDEQDGGSCSVEVADGRTCVVTLRCGTGQSLPTFDVSKEREHCRLGKLRYLVDLPEHDCSIVLRFSQNQDQVQFRDLLNKASGRFKKKSVFNERTEKASAAQYFQFYGYLSQQQNMMQDYIRTSTYQRAMLQNTVDFQDKVVIDVGAGSGILSFFAVQAGARKVYAIEASSMATHCKTLVESNGLSQRIIVVPGKVEEVEIPEKADMIISEPMGYMLFNERMLESYVHAKKWLKPGGKMFPTEGNMYVAPFFDEALYMEHCSKANFWHQSHFYGVNLSHLQQSAVNEYLRQPIVDTFDVRHLMAKPVMHTVNFLSAAEEDLHRIRVPLKFTITTAGSLHGLAFWFDVVFDGSSTPVWLSTAPHEPLTHWYQVRCLLQTPVLVKEGQIVKGVVLLVANQRQSYDVEIELTMEGTGMKSRNHLDLKNPFFRYTGTQPAPPPGTSTTSPTELYWGLASSGDAVGVVSGNHLGGGGMLNAVGGLGLSTVYGQGVDHSPYVGDAAGGLPVVNSITNGGGNPHYVTNRYIVGSQPAVIPVYSGGGCGEGMAGYTSTSHQRLTAMQYSR